MANPKHLFTRSSLTAITPPVSGRSYFGDTQARGLILDVQASGNKTFRLNRKIQGTPTKITLGRFNPAFPESRDFASGMDPIALIGNASELNVRMARKLAEAVNASLDRGVNPAQHARHARNRAAEELTLRQAFEKYFREHLVPHQKRTATDLCNDFDRYLGTVQPGQKKLRGREKVKSPGAVDWANRKLSSISQTDIRTMMIGLSENVGPRTANKVFVLLRSIFNKMIDWKAFSGENPCLGLNKFKEVSRERFVTGDELPRFLAAVDEIAHQDFKDFVLLSLFTGARRANVLAMRWQDINFDAGLFNVPSEVSKSGLPLTIPITSPARAILERRKLQREAVGFESTNPYVFSAKSKSGHMSPPSKRWKSLLVASGVSDLRLHDLRRSLGSWAAMGGASLPIIGKMLGHSSSESTAVYARLQSGPVALAMETATTAMLARGRQTNGIPTSSPILPPLPPIPASE